jgi:hypothetical protein
MLKADLRTKTTFLLKTGFVMPAEKLKLVDYNELNSGLKFVLAEGEKMNRKPV